MKHNVEKYNRLRVLILVSLIVVFFTLLLLFSTDILLGCLHLQLRKDTLPNVDTAQQIFYSFDSISVADNITQTTELVGLAYMETSEPNPNKKISLYLVSDDAAYQIGASLTERIDITAQSTGKMIQGSRHMFDATFSPIQLPDGIYELYIYCYENEHTFGVINTNCYFEKNQRIFEHIAQTTYPETSKSVDIDATCLQIYPEYYHSIDEIKIMDGYLLIRGWGLRVGTPSEGQQNNILLTNSSGRYQVYSTQQYRNLSLRHTFSSDLYDYSFFYANIPITELSPGEYYFTLLMNGEDSESWLCPWQKYFSYEEDEILNYDSTLLPTVIPTNFSKIVNINTEQFLVDEQLYHSIDICTLQNDGCLTIKGWGVELGTSSDDATVFLAFTNTKDETVIYDSTPYFNPYLRDILQSDLYDNAFFECNIPLAEFPPDTYTLTVLVAGQRYGRSSVSHTVVVSEEKTIEYTA